MLVRRGACKGSQMFKHAVKVCPKTGRIISKPVCWWWPLAGLMALLWYVLRVGPKPSRALYPCQRVAGPIAWGFMGYLLSFAASVTFFRKTRSLFWQARYGLAAVCAAVAAVTALVAWDGTSLFARAAAPWTPSQPPNTPLGVARGIHPGRVVWVRDPAATRWDGNNGHWWDPEATDQKRVDAMTEQALCRLTGERGPAAAWRALFTSHNRTHGKGDQGYRPGQKIVIKINQNTARDGHAFNGNPRNENSINGNPHLILALLRQLVHHAGVAQADIYLYDISRYFPDNIFVPCHREFPQVHFMEVDKGGGEGRDAVPPEREWVQNVITYKDPGRGLGRHLPSFIIDADYMINMAIMKNHGDVGPTLLAKNHFGTVHGLNHGAIAPKRMGESNPLVDLMAHKDVGEKTVLHMIDTLYAADGPDATPRKWKLAPFGTEEMPGWPASLFVSQDGVALESVGFDFVNAEWGVDPFTDNMLREAALANDPPSGPPYGPVSLGVFEHWNNAKDKQYSRDLGTGKGIELVRVFFPGAPTTVLSKPADGKVELQWEPTDGADGYLVARATGKEAAVVVGGVAGTAFTDTKVVNGQTYRYALIATNELGRSGPSTPVVVQPGAFVAAINAGGAAMGQFTADAHFDGGGVGNPSRDAVLLAGDDAFAPPALYQTERNGNFSYGFDGLTKGASYRVRLHFAETYFSERNQRVFHVAINGNQVMTDVDLVAITGGRHRALVREFPAKTDADGRITVAFTSVRNNAKCSGIEILAAP
jgi:hypothetical protein